MKRRIPALLLLFALLFPLPGPAETGGIRPGDTVRFGHYSTADGAGPIEWRVLEVRGTEALLLSEHILDTHTYHPERDTVTWEESGIRAYLNNAFLHRAFTPAEEAALCWTDVDNSDGQGDPEYTRTHGGPDTRDRIFLLSWKEAFERYFADEAVRSCDPTDYAAAQGAARPGWWWLRSPGNYQSRAVAVNAKGAQSCPDVDHLSGGIRPACRVDVTAPVFRAEQNAATPEAIRPHVDPEALRGVWIGFLPVYAQETDNPSDIQMIRFDPKTGHLDALFCSGYDTERLSLPFRVREDTLVLLHETDGDVYEEEIPIRLIGQRLLMNWRGTFSLARVEDGSFPEDASGSPFIGEDRQYWLTLREDGTLCAVHTGESAGETLAFPSTALGLKITAVRGGGDEETRTILLPEGIVTVLPQAFGGLERLERVQFPSTLKSIQYSAFEYCPNLREIVLPEGLQYIGDDAFYDCVRLNAVTLPESLSVIGEGAFRSENSPKIAFTVRTGSFAEGWCRERQYGYLALNADGSVREDRLYRVRVSNYLEEEHDHSLYSLLYAGEAALEDGLAPEALKEELFALAEEQGEGVFLKAVLGNSASEDTEETRRLLDFPDRESRTLWMDPLEGVELAEGLGVSIYDTPYVPDALKAVLTDSDAAYCTEPFFWAESDFETFYGIPFSRFRPAHALPGLVCPVIRDSARSSFLHSWKNEEDSRHFDFLSQLEEVLHLFHIAPLTGNPQLASSFWVLDVSYPFRGYYGEQGEVKGYNCQLTLTVLNASDHRTVAEFTSLRKLEDTIYDWEDGIAQAEWPDPYEFSERETGAFLRSVRAYLASQTE